MSDFRLCIATTTWRRPELTEAVFEWWEQFWADIPAVEMLGNACGDYRFMERTPVSIPFWSSWPHANEPLGAKWNAVLKDTALYYPDAVLVIGSDNLCHPDWIRFCIEQIKQGADIVGSNTMHFVDLATDRVMRSRGRWGVRCYSRKLLDAYDWKLWRDDSEDRLDSDVERLLIKDPRFAFREVWRDDGLIVDIKSPEGPNIWTFDEMEAMTQHRMLRYSATEWLDKHFPDFRIPVFQEA